jgi:hypothetical protein
VTTAWRTASGKFLIDNAEHVHLDAGSQERDDWMHVRGDSRRRVQCDWSRQVFVSLPNIVGFKEVARRACAIDFDAFGLTAVLSVSPMSCNTGPLARYSWSNSRPRRRPVNPRK